MRKLNTSINCFKINSRVASFVRFACKTAERGLFGVNVRCKLRVSLSNFYLGYAHPYTCRLTRLGFDPVHRNTIGFRNNYEIARIIAQEIPLTYSSTLHHFSAQGAIKTRHHNGLFIRFYPPLVNPSYVNVNACMHTLQ